MTIDGQTDLIDIVTRFTGLLSEAKENLNGSEMLLLIGVMEVELYGNTDNPESSGGFLAYAKSADEYDKEHAARAAFDTPLGIALDDTPGSDFIGDIYEADDRFLMDDSDYGDDAWDAYYDRLVD